MERERLSLPMVALRGMAVLPEMVTHFDVSREKSIQAIERAMEGDQLLFLAAQKDVEVEDPGIADVYETGCVVSIKQRTSHFCQNGTVTGLESVQKCV